MTSIVYKVTFPDGESTYFGAQASAIACARSTGTVTEVMIHESQNNVTAETEQAMVNSERELDAMREALKMCEGVIGRMHIHNEIDIPLANNALNEIRKLTHKPPTSAYKRAGDLVRCPIRGWISNKTNPLPLTKRNGD